MVRMQTRKVLYSNRITQRVDSVHRIESENINFLFQLSPM
jgi:hypothetical protein